MSDRAVVLSRILFVAAFVGVTILSIVPSPPSVGLESDKLSHFLAYAVMTFLLVMSLSGDRKIPRGFWLALGAVIIYGGLIELVQRYTGRQFDLRDMAANAAGVVSGGGLALLGRIRKRPTG